MEGRGGIGDRRAGDRLPGQASLIHWSRRAAIDPADTARLPEALRRSEALFRAISDASPLGIFVSDAAGECVYTNAAYQKISGLSFKQALGTNWSKAIHPEDRPRVVAEWREAADERELFRAEVRFLRADQSVVWARLNARAMRDGETLHGYVQTVEDITERVTAESVLRAAEEALYEEKERAQVTLNSIGDAVLTTDIEGKVSYLNVVAERMTGWSRGEAIGQPLADVFRIIDGLTRATATNPAERAIAENRTVGLSADCILVRRGGVEFSIEDSAAPIHDRNGRVTGAVIVFHDVSESRAMAEKMAYLAQHDFLTGLANRALLTERLDQAIGQARRHQKQVALLFVDLDDFKRINDSMGHTVGDQLLKLVAERLVNCVRSTDTVCRQGGDEFVILLTEIEQPNDAASVADKVITSLAVPQRVGEHEYTVTLSIGISVYPDDSHDLDTVMQNADAAMYQAKASGGNNYRFFGANQNAPGQQAMFVE